MSEVQPMVESPGRESLIPRRVGAFLVCLLALWLGVVIAVIGGSIMSVMAPLDSQGQIRDLTGKELVAVLGVPAIGAMTAGVITFAKVRFVLPLRCLVASVVALAVEAALVIAVLVTYFIAVARFGR
jgi:hypothetical protein